MKNVLIVYEYKPEKRLHYIREVIKDRHHDYVRKNEIIESNLHNFLYDFKTAKKILKSVIFINRAIEHPSIKFYLEVI